MPPDWLAFHDGAPVGSTVPIPLDLEEMGLPEGMTAQVTANNPCPAIDQGPGRVVLTTVNHLNPRVVELTLRPVAPQYSLPSAARGRAGEGTDAGHVHSLPSEARGRAGEGGDAGHVLPLQPSISSNQETVRPTAFHKFYSETRDQWLSAEDLQPGERLRGLTGPLQVVSQRPIPGTHRVYNITVEGEHVYHVSTLGVLAHNTRCGQSAADQAEGLLTGHSIERIAVQDFRSSSAATGKGKVIYILEDANSGEILKAGLTHKGKKFIGRYEKYLAAENYVNAHVYGRKLEATLIHIDDAANLRITENQVKNFFAAQGHKLPWDNATPNGRLGRPGPGIPGTRISSASKAYREGYRRWIGETLVKD